MAIAWNRYRLIITPNDIKTNVTAAVFITVGIWIISGAVTFPYGYNMKIIHVPGLCGEFCTEAWGDGLVSNVTFTNVVFVCQFIVPIILMTFCYTRIFMVLKERMGKKLANGCQMTNADMKRETLIRKRRRSTIILACMVLVFVFTWMPLNLIHLMSNYKFNFPDYYR